MILFI